MKFSLFEDICAGQHEFTFSACQLKMNLNTFSDFMERMLYDALICFPATIHIL